MMQLAGSSALLRHEYRRAFRTLLIRVMYGILPLALVWFIKPAFEFVITGSDVTPAAEQTAAGQFTLWGPIALTLFGYSYFDDILNHTAERLRAWGVGWTSIIGSKIVVTFTSQIVMGIVLFAGTSVLFDTFIWSDPLPRLALIVAWSGVMSGLALFCVAAGRNTPTFILMLYSFALLYPAAGGGLAPVQLLPSWAITVGKFVPSSWFMRAIDDIAAGHGTFNDIGGELAILVAWAAGLILVSAVLFVIRQPPKASELT